MRSRERLVTILDSIPRFLDQPNSIRRLKVWGPDILSGRRPTPATKPWGILKRTAKYVSRRNPSPHYREIAREILTHMERGW